MKTVAVIGCGPAGVLAAYAALQEGAEVTVWSPPGVGKSPIHGAQYIHGEVVGLPESAEPFYVRYRYVGTEEGYRQKIYGDSVPTNGTSWGMFRPKELAWPMGAVYDYLWNVVELNAAVGYRVLTGVDLLRMVEEYDYVLNTAPLNKLTGGTFTMEEVYALPKNMLRVPENEIWYLGDEDRAYRASNIAGHPSTEYPTREAVPAWNRAKATRVIKPLDCQVELPGVYRLGRYGKWQKGQLAHHAYEEARTILQKVLPWTATLPV
jgi:hypothetical protein